MKADDYRRILDFFFSGAEVSEELKQQFLGWLGVHGEEPEVKNLLEEYWNEISSASPEFDISAGLEKLMASVGGGNDNPGLKAGIHEKAAENQVNRKSIKRQESGLDRMDVSGKEKRGKAVWKYCIAAAAALLIFLGGAVTSELVMNPQKTILMASSENVGSFTLPDGSKVWLNKNSWISYDRKFGRRQRKVALNGEGYFEVSRDESRPFMVKMQNNLEVKVLGTTFNTCSYPGAESSEVILRSGSVQVSDTRSKELVILKPDQKYIWTNGRTEVSDVNATNCCRWFESRLVFDNVKLKDILENLSHKYQIKLNCDIGRLSEKRMSMTIRDESIEDFLDVLTTLLPVQWKRTGNEINIGNKTKKH